MSGLPAGVKVNLTQNGYGGIGLPNYRTASSFIVMSIPAEVNPGEYDYTIHLSYQGIDFGVVPCVLKVFPSAAETFGITYVPGEFLYVWGTTNSPVPDGTSLTSQLGEWRQTGIINGSTWSANFTLGKDGVPSTLDAGTYNLYVWPADNAVVIGGVSFSIVPPPSPAP